MGILSLASSASAWYGYEYFMGKKVVSCNRINEEEYEGDVKGSSKEPYRVLINTIHPRKSRCNCPHAEGKRIICKHMVAMLFTAFPKEADLYMAAVDEYEREEYQREKEHNKEILKYVFSLSKAELRSALFNALLEAEERKRYY